MTPNEGATPLTDAIYEACAVQSSVWRMFSDMTEHARSLERRLAAALAERRAWVPVSERLPKCWETVLITDGVDKATGFLSESNEWHWHDYEECHEAPRFWMPYPPLPAAPQEDRKEKGMV